MRIIIFGDSITQGFWDTEHGGWANRLHINEMRRGVESAFENSKMQYAEIIQKAKMVGPVALVGIAPIDETKLDPIPWHLTHSYLEESRRVFDEAVQQLAAEYGCIYIAMGDVFGDDVAGKTVDGIHPNAEGHRLMFERIRGALSEAGL